MDSLTIEGIYQLLHSFLDGVTSCSFHQAADYVQTSENSDPVTTCNDLINLKIHGCTRINYAQAIVSVFRFNVNHNNQTCRLNLSNLSTDNIFDINNFQQTKLIKEVCNNRVLSQHIKQRIMDGDNPFSKHLICLQHSIGFSNLVPFMLKLFSFDQNSNVHYVSTKMRWLKEQLFEACRKENLDIIKLCIKYGVNINTTSKYGSPLMIACCGSKTDRSNKIVEYLLNLPNIDVNFKDSDGCTAVYYAIAVGQSLTKVRLLVENGANVHGMFKKSYQLKNVTYLMEASRYGYDDIVRYLITTCKVDVTQRSSTNEDALTYYLSYHKMRNSSEWYRDNGIVSLFLEHGAACPVFPAILICNPPTQAITY